MHLIGALSGIGKRAAEDDYSPQGVKPLAALNKNEALARADEAYARDWAGAIGWAGDERDARSEGIKAHREVMRAWRNRLAKLVRLPGKL